jgi:hypothetical protein
MRIEVRTRRGRCATHGTVEATKEIPRLQFPVMIYAIRRATAKRRPFLCPICGEALEPS